MTFAWMLDPVVYHAETAHCQDVECRTLLIELGSCGMAFGFCPVIMVTSSRNSGETVFKLRLRARATGISYFEGIQTPPRNSSAPLFHHLPGKRTAS